MATVDQVQTSLGTNGKDPQILKTEEGATLRQNYVAGGAICRGYADWVTTTISDAAATQAAAIRAALIRG